MLRQYSDVLLLWFHLFASDFEGGHSGCKKEDRLAAWVNAGMKEVTVAGSNKFRS